MSQAYFRFYAELNDFLRPNRRTFSLVHTFEGHPSIKDTIEALGVPHTEVDLILANGDSVDFSYSLQDGDRISVYPVFEAIDITPILRVRPQPLRDTRFIVDANLGRLADYLRMFGFDTWYRNDYADAELAYLSRRDKRILLTRDIGLLKRSLVTHGYYLRETHPQAQLVEVLRRFDLCGSVAPLQRCLRCNGFVQTVDKQTLIGELRQDIWERYDEFSRCHSCQQIYWKGSHYQEMQKFVETILAMARNVV